MKIILDGVEPDALTVKWVTPKEHNFWKKATGFFARSAAQNDPKSCSFHRIETAAIKSHKTPFPFFERFLKEDGHERARFLKGLRPSSHVFSQKFHSRYNFGYGILLYMREMPYFCPFTAHFGGFMGIFSYINDKSAPSAPVKTEVADFVSFKGSIVQGLKIYKKMLFYSCQCDIIS